MELRDDDWEEASSQSMQMPFLHIVTFCFTTKRLNSSLTSAESGPDSSAMQLQACPTYVHDSSYASPPYFIPSPAYVVSSHRRQDGDLLTQAQASHATH